MQRFLYISCNCLRYETATGELYRMSRKKNDGVYAESDIYTVSSSVSDCSQYQAKRFLEKNVSSYNSPSSV